MVKCTNAMDSGTIRNGFGNHKHPLSMANRKLINKFIGASWRSWLLIVIMALIWPSISWNFALLNYFHLKRMVYDANKPNTISELKDEILRVIHDLRLELYRKGMRNFVKMADVGRAVRSGHLIDIIICHVQCQPLINMFCLIYSCTVCCNKPICFILN